MTRPILELRPGQHLTLTPQLQQSIRLLQLSTLELEAEISQVLAENPLLDREDESPSAEAQVRHLLGLHAAGPAPKVWIGGVADMGGAVAFRLASDDLDRLRGELVEQLHGLLSAQDSAGWWPHVTIQNKVEPRAAKALARLLEGHRRGAPLRIAGLGLHRYLGGPWEKLQLYPFRGR